MLLSGYQFQPMLMLFLSTRLLIRAETFENMMSSFASCGEAQQITVVRICCCINQNKDTMEPEQLVSTAKSGLVIAEKLQSDKSSQATEDNTVAVASSNMMQAIKMPCIQSQARDYLGGFVRGHNVGQDVDSYGGIDDDKKPAASRSRSVLTSCSSQ